MYRVAAALYPDAARDRKCPVIIDIHQAGFDPGAQAQAIAILHPGVSRLETGIIVEPTEAKKGWRHGEARKSNQVVI